LIEINRLGEGRERRAHRGYTLVCSTCSASGALGCSRP
jgi:hypothetical protein